MRYSNFNGTCLMILSFCIVRSASAVSAFAVVGVYDDNQQGNSVDKSAWYDESHSTGVGKEASLILDIRNFSPLIPEAFTNSHGGVVNFDNGLIAAGQQTDSFAALFNGKAVLFQSVDPIRNDYVSSTRTPISGPDKPPGGGFLAKSIVKGDVCSQGGSYVLTLTEYGFDPDEHVRAISGTILGRNNSDKNGNWIMKVTLDNGDIVAASASIDLAAGNASDDTFFGAYAPAGRYITGVSWICDSGEFSGLDDLAFITGASDFSPPEIKITEKPVQQNGLDRSGGYNERPGSGRSTLFGTDKPQR